MIHPYSELPQHSPALLCRPTWKCLSGRSPSIVVPRSRTRPHQAVTICRGAPPHTRRMPATPTLAPHPCSELTVALFQTYFHTFHMPYTNPAPSPSPRRCAVYRAGLHWRSLSACAALGGDGFALLAPEFHTFYGLPSPLIFAACEPSPVIFRTATPEGPSRATAFPSPRGRPLVRCRSRLRPPDGVFGPVGRPKVGRWPPHTTASPAAGPS